MQQFDLSNLPPRLHVAEEQPLSEMAEKVNQFKIHQENCHHLVLRGMKAAYVHIQFPHVNRVPPQ